MTFKEFIDCLYEAADCEGYIDRESEDIKTIEEIIGLDFSLLSEEEIFAYVQGMKTMYEMQSEWWLYFEDEEDKEV